LAVLTVHLRSVLTAQEWSVLTTHGVPLAKVWTWITASTDLGLCLPGLLRHTLRLDVG